MMGYLQCTKQHPLVWSTDSTGYMMGKFSCDGCHTSHNANEGRWTCKGCKYDICPHCRPGEAMPGSAEPVPMTAYVQCKNGDALGWTTNCAGYLGNKFNCDICHKTFPCGIGRWSCQMHKYDLCHACREPVDQKCPAGHSIKASWDSTGYLMGKYSCDSCKASYPCETGRYTCPCKYDICPVCKSK